MVLGVLLELVGGYVTFSTEKKGPYRQQYGLKKILTLEKSSFRRIILSLLNNYYREMGKWGGN